MWAFVAAAFPVLFCLGMYLWQAVMLFGRGDFWMASVYLGYAFSNIGLAVLAARAAGAA